MRQNRERWFHTPIPKERILNVAQEFKLDPLLAKLLLMEEIGSQEPDPHAAISAFINPPESLLTDLDGLSHPDHVKRGVERIRAAVQNNEKVMVQGDPDADGITGAAILVAGLRKLGLNVFYEFPTRPKEGHGLQPRIIDEAKRLGVSVLITSDCGSKDIIAVQYANSLQIDVIVCDHHRLGKKLPESYAIINPYLAPTPTLAINLAGASVSFKFIQAIFLGLQQEVPQKTYNFMLAAAALGTLSDRMSLRNPMNRLIVKRGIEVLNRTQLTGMKALRDASTHGQTELKPHDISRTIAPKLNAPGRIGDRDENIPDSRIVVELLLLGTGKRGQTDRLDEVLDQFSYAVDMDQSIKNEKNACNEAAMVDDVNERRKYITGKIEDEIEILTDEQVQETDRLIIIQGKNWNSGVIGIDTDRLRDRYLRPAMILTTYDKSDYIRGSVRSIPTINMYQIVDQVADVFEEKHNKSLFKMEVETRLGKRFINAFGGHAQACGFTLHKDDLKEFIQIIREEMTKLQEEQFHYFYHVLDTLSFNDINEKLVRDLDALSPYGQGFDYPIFYMKKCRLSPARPFGNKYQEFRTPHVEFSVLGQAHHRSEEVRKLSAVGFGLFDKYVQIYSPKHDQFYDLIFTLDRSRPGRKKRKSYHLDLRLNVLDIRPCK